MKIVAISDTHGMHDKLKMPDGDVVVHAGDCSERGDLKSIVDFVQWYSKLPYKYKIMVHVIH